MQIILLSGAVFNVEKGFKMDPNLTNLFFTNNICIIILIMPDWLYIQLLYSTKLSWLHGKLLFRHKTFAIAHDGPKDYACEGDY